MSRVGVTSSLSSKLKQIERIANLIDRGSVSTSGSSGSSAASSPESGSGELLNVKT